MVLERRRAQSRKEKAKKSQPKSKVIKAVKPKSPRASVPGRASAANGRKSTAAKATRKSSCADGAPNKASKRVAKSKSKTDDLTSKQARALAKKLDAAAKKADALKRQNDAPQMFKRPARADGPAEKVFKRPSKAEDTPPVVVLKRPARASSADAVLKRPARSSMLANEQDDEMAAAAKAWEQFNKDMDVENLVEAQVKRVERRSCSPAPTTPRFAPMTPQRAAPSTPNFSRSPTVPACFAVNMADLLSDGPAPMQTQRRSSQVTVQPKTWGISAPKLAGSCAPRSPGGPRGRRSAATSLFGDNLDDLLPSEDQLRLKGNVPRECFDRAQKRRASASRDLRSSVGMTETTPPSSPPPARSERPLASPTRNRSRKSVSSAPQPFESSPSKRKASPCSPPRSLSRQPSWVPPPAPGLAVPNVKAALNEAGVDTSKCTEIELEALWERFKEVRGEPLAVLQHRCRQQMPAVDASTFSTADKCAAFLVTDHDRRPSVGAESASSPARQPDRVGDAMMGAGRILSVRPARFANKVEWGFAVLDKPRRDLVSVQKAYRALMRPLHPDRAGSQSDVVRAVDLLREAKDLCERALRQQNPPDRPTRLSSTHLCTEPGRRRFKVQWKAPESRESAPVHRYIVAVFDPSYGRALAVGTLEPDYHQELQRYLAYDDAELCSYVLSEEDLKKMPNLFKSDAITVQVAAGNNEGQSDWSVLKVRLQATRSSTSALPRDTSQRAPAMGRGDQPSNVLPPRRASPPRAPRASPRRASSAGQASAVIPDEDRAFDVFVEAKNGRELLSWLQQQKKEKMQGWLKRRFQQMSGSKEACMERIIAFKEDNSW